MNRVLVTSWLAVLFAEAFVAAAAEDIVWVSDLETTPQLVGKEIVLEGRFQGRIGASLDQVRLKGCNPDRIEFRLDSEILREKFPSNLPFIRLTGTLTRSGDKLVMRVKAWSKTAATDEERFHDAARRIETTDHKAWYELASRMQRLADLYNEQELKALAAGARVRGFRAEEAVLRSSQAAELLKLADRASEVGQNAEEARRMRHKALRWKYDALAQASGSAREWFQLATELEQFLPGSQAPLTAADAKLLSQYRAKPIEVYDTTPKGRNTCDRAIWVDTITAALLAQSKEPNADLATLAKEATKKLPDRPELAQQFLRQWAEQEVSRGTVSLPAAQVRRLAEVFRHDLADAKRAQEVLRQWLDGRRNKLSARDADGRVRLARDFRADLKDDDTAVKLLLEAVQIEADLPDAARELNALGYVATPGGWKPASQVPVAEKPVRVVNNRLPEKNMTADQVRNIMGDPRPGDKIRLAYRTEGQLRVTEQWTYRGPPDIYVTFLIDSSKDARVIAINTPSQK
jgi:hypothetical protein